MKKYKFSGLLCIIIGVICLVVLYFLNFDELTIHYVDLSTVKIVGPIILINCGLYAIILGTMFWAGKMVPYYKADKLEQAKNNFWGSLICSPSFVGISSMAIMSQEIIIKILGVGFLAIFCFLLFTGFTTIKKYKVT